MKRLILFALLFSNLIALSQEQNPAVIVNDEAKQVDGVFYAKLTVMLVLGIIALLTYLKFRKSEVK